MALAGMTRLHIVLGGAVQGTGFRPTIYRIAQSLRLEGWVRDTDAGIELEVQGEARLLATFVRRLRSEQPRTAVVSTEVIARMAPQQSTWFEILPDLPRPTASTPPAGAAG